ncbi:MAG: hypothetical protein WD315_02780 [Balneolaceae bacterium]
MINRETIEELARKSDSLNLTITMPTHKKGEEVQQNPIRFKNLIVSAKAKLTEKGLRPQQVDEWMKGPEQLLEDLNYWNHTDEGFVLCMNESVYRIFQLPYSVSEQVYLNDHFLVTPLFPMVSMNGTWHVLALSSKNIRLLRCTREQVEDVTPDDIFRSIDDYIDEKPEAHLQFHTGASGKDAMFFGHGGSNEEKKTLLKKYLHGVEESVTRDMKKSGDPLLIAATEEVFSMYRSLNKYNRLHEEPIEGHSGEMKAHELRDIGWEKIKTVFLKEMYRAIDQFSSQKRDEVSNNLSEIVESTVMGKTDTLFVSMDEFRWGHYDETEHTVHLENGRESDQSTELLNWTALKAMEQGARIYVLPRNEMPDRSDIAALYRF